MVKDLERGNREVMEGNDWVIFFWEVRPLKELMKH